MLYWLMATIKPQYEAFAHLAEAYCDAIEDPSITGMAGLRTLHDLLLPLHGAAMNLPEMKNGKNADRTLSSEEAQTVFKSLKQRLPIDTYWDTFDPLKGPVENLIPSSLADDLRDIWCDLKNGLIQLKLEGERAQPAVWWEWRFGFVYHWGHHSSGALRVMYFALRDIS